MSSQQRQLTGIVATKNYNVRGRRFVLAEKEREDPRSEDGPLVSALQRKFLKERTGKGATKGVRSRLGLWVREERTRRR